MARIPKVFHFVYGIREQAEPFPLAFYLAVRSCLEVNDPDAVVVHLVHEPWGRYWDLLRPQIEVAHALPAPEVQRHCYNATLVPPRYRYAHHADFIRLDVLIEGGGVYADIDTIFVRPIPDALYDHPFVMGREAPVTDPRTGVTRPSLCNAVLMAEPASEFAMTWRGRMEAALEGWSDHSTLLPAQLQREFPSDVHVEPERTFYPYGCTPAGLHSLLESADGDPLEDVCSVHLWSHLWWEPQRLDFCSFNGAMITEHHVRSVDTTYNRLARPHLPAFDPQWFAAEAARRSVDKPARG